MSQNIYETDAVLLLWGNMPKATAICLMSALAKSINDCRRQLCAAYSIMLVSPIKHGSHAANLPPPKHHPTNAPQSPGAAPNCRPNTPTSRFSELAYAALQLIRSAVHTLNKIPVSLFNNLAPGLQGWCELAVFNAEWVIKKHKASHTLVIC